MATDIFSQAIQEWNALVRRVDAAVEVGWTGFKGMSWDVLVERKSPSQVLQEVRALAGDFERKEQEYRKRQLEAERRQLEAQRAQRRQY